MNYPPATGTPEFRAVAAHTFTEESGIEGVTANDVIVHSGGKGVLNLIGRQFEPGEQVLVAAPGWPTNYDFWNPGVKITEVDTDGRGLMTPEVLRQALNVNRTATAILINDPSNPTGARYSEEERAEIMSIIAEHRAKFDASFMRKPLRAIVDDPYGALNYDGTSMKRSAAEKTYSMMAASWS